MKLEPTVLNRRFAKAVASYWATRQSQSVKQASSGQRDQGARSAVTGGAQMDGFIALITELILEAGIKQEYIFHNTALELPGFFRPTKEWDLLVVRDGQLILALETKSQVGPSFGNNSITEPKKRWAVLLTCGRHFEKELSIKAFVLGSATFSCWKTAKAHGVP